MQARIAVSILVLAVSPTPAAAQTTPFAPNGQQPDRGVPFQLPQERNAAGRRVTVEASNALTISWDGRVLLYADSGPEFGGCLNALTDRRGYVFTTFDKSRAVDENDDEDSSYAMPDFTHCFGDAPLARFASICADTRYDSRGTYPEPGRAYPPIPGTMGELGLLQIEFLSANLYPAATSAPGSQNPYRGLSDGTYSPAGPYRIYDAWVTMRDATKYWIQGRWRGFNSTDFYTKYESGVYPNGVEGQTTLRAKRNGRCKLRIFVLLGTGGDKDEVVQVDVLEKWTPFTISGDDADFATVSAPPTPGYSIPTASTMWADNFEPNLTMDGPVMVGKGSPLLCRTDLPSRVCFYYNPVAFAADGWRGPWELTELYDKRDVVLDGRTIGERYPIARRPLRDYDGTVLTSADAFEGGYPWLSPDGRYVLYTCLTGGVGTNHPETSLAQDGGGTSNRAHVSIVGSVTGWQMWRIDHAAVNATRHMFTGWDQDSRTAYQRTSSFGFSPGFWDMLKGAEGVPVRDDGALKLQLVNNQLLRYFELDLSPYQERDYGFYLPMSLMIQLNQPGNEREVDLGRTPDHSGNGHTATVLGGQLPCEYFNLPSNTSATPGSGTLLGFYAPAMEPEDIQPGWTTLDTVSGSGGHWALLADWVDGKPDVNGGSTSPFEGRGNRNDMDSDYAWGRVGQAMFFKHRKTVMVPNPGASAAELHPGTNAAGATDGLTASLWVRPLQARTAATNLFKHHVRIALETDGGITAAVKNLGGVEHAVSSAAGAATDLDWTHVALTWRVSGVNESELRLYVNGAEAAALTALPFETLSLSTQPIFAGCLDLCATDPSSAVLLLDEVALKNSALTVPDVENLALRPILDATWGDEGFPPGPAPFTTADERVPEGHAYDANLANIGADLFHDVQLSSTKTVSCASCHVPDKAFTDGLRRAIGLNGQLLRNTPTLFDLRYTTRQFWDARDADLEDQALDPVFDADEMGFHEWADIEGYIRSDPDYSTAFLSWPPLMGGPIEEHHVRQAIATYVRLLTAGNAPADQVPIDPMLAPGKALFEGKARCIGCHDGPNFTDGLLRVTGTFRRDGNDDGASREDAGERTAGRKRFLGAFKTPTLRELTRTAPYFHDGHAADLAAVVDFYDAGGVRTDSNGFLLDEVEHDGVDEETNRVLGLTTTEKDQLIEYLEALTAGPAGSSNGPPGWNRQPTVNVIVGGGSGPLQMFPHSPYPGGGGTGPPNLVFDVTDPEGQADLDTTMAWTLEVVARVHRRDWSHGTLTPILNGWRVAMKIPGGVRSGDSIRVADHHGRWSELVVIP